MFQVSTTPIVRSTQNCNYSLRYDHIFCAANSLQRGQVEGSDRDREATLWYAGLSLHTTRSLT